MKLILVDPRQEVCLAWVEAFKDADGMLPKDLSIRMGRIECQTDADMLVTAGNSFGLMDGGVDLAVAQAFPGIEQRVQMFIRERYHGELNVGDATVVSIVARTGSYTDVIYAPTMRVPMDIRGTDNVYRAMWAALRLSDIFSVRDLAVPGLGTGAGKMSPTEAARQMALAWRNFNDVPEAPTWKLANDRHHEIAGRACCEVTP